MIDLTPRLQFLVGEPVSGVCFVTDYVELHFNGSYLRCLEPVSVLAPTSEEITFPGAGARDALSGRIGAEVRAIEAAEGGELQVTFSDGAIVRMPMSHETRRSPEALHFHNQTTGETQWW